MILTGWQIEVRWQIGMMAGYIKLPIVLIKRGGEVMTDGQTDGQLLSYGPLRN